MSKSDPGVYEHDGFTMFFRELLAHSLMLQAIAAMKKKKKKKKKKNDKIDVSKIADRLRCDFLLECYMTWDRDRRRTPRYRGLLVK